MNDDEIARIAREADADPRSVVRRLAGLPVKGRAGRRIDTIIDEFRIPVRRDERSEPAR